MKIVVLDGYTLNPGDNPWDPVERHGELVVHDRTPDDLIVERARDADIVLTNKTVLTAESIAALPKLKLIAVLATGYNVVDVAAARERGVLVSNVPEYSTDNVAQHVFAVLLSLCHHPVLHDRLIREGEWQKDGEFCFWRTPLIELAGRTMGVVGFGRIGRRVGQLANAFGMGVLANSRTMDDPPDYEPFVWGSVEEVFERSDVVTLHAPQTDETAGMVNASLLARMKPTAFLINTARGGLVNEADLAAALNAGKLAGAALDVFSSEPLNPDNPLLGAKNCLMTPHIAWATHAARVRLMRTVGDNVGAFIAGRPQNVVN